MARKSTKVLTEPSNCDEEIQLEQPGDEVVPAEAVVAQKFVLTGPIGCVLTVNIHYVESGSAPTEVKILTKEFKGQNFVDIVTTITAGVRRLVAMIKPSGGYLIKIHPRKLVVQGFSDASGVYQHERAMSALAGVLYLIAFGGQKIG